MIQNDLEQLVEDWPRMREEISKLKKQNDELKGELQNTACLAHNIWIFFQADMDTKNRLELRSKILSLFRSLYGYLEV